MTTSIERTEAGTGASLETLVDRLMDAVLGTADGPVPSAARTIHDARRLRQAGDCHGALAVLSDIDIGAASEREARWAQSEWITLARRTFGGGDAMVYRQGTGRAAVVLPAGRGRVTVAAAVGFRWRPGRRFSRRSLRGLRPLAGVA